MCYDATMLKIGVRELRQHASRYLDRVKAGETVEVTERGRLIALLQPVTGTGAARERLIAGGRLVPAAAPFQVPRPVKARPGTPSTGDVLDDLRTERGS